MLSPISGSGESALDYYLAEAMSKEKEGAK